MKTKDTILAVGNAPVMAILSLAGFLWLGHLAQKAENLKTLERYGLTREGAANYEPAEDKRPSKLALAQVKAYAYLYGLDESDVAKPVVLWGEGL